MNSFFNSFTEFMRGIITEDVFFIYVGLAAIPGFFCMIALYISILRIHFAIKRDGKEPPGLGPISLIEMTTALKATHSQYEKKIQIQAQQNVGFVSYALIQPYIKPMDRFFSRVWHLSGALLLISLPFAYWLYPEIFN